MTATVDVSVPHGRCRVGGATRRHAPALVAEIAGVRREWDAEITEQTPDQRIGWRATDGTANAGVITFHRLDDDRTRLGLQRDIEPEGVVETVGDELGFIRRRAEGDLKRFKELIEARGVESGAWRGTVEQEP